MTEEFPIHPQVCAWLDASVLRAHVPQYLAYLRERRYARQTVRYYLYNVAHFAVWATMQQLTIEAVNEAAAVSFVESHLSECRCPYPVRRNRDEIRAALRHLLEALRAGGVLAPRRRDADPVAVEVSRFQRYMQDTCGLAKNTCRQRSHIVSKFLDRLRPIGPASIERLDAKAFRSFVLNPQLRHSPGTIGVIAGTLRCYLRFRALEGDRVSHLLDAVPKAANWRLAILPQVFTDAEIERLLNSFTELRHSPKRAYAMARCLVDLGLRAGDVIGLQLEDIHWQEGTIHLIGGKSRRGDILPLPAITGQAIAEYVCTERPRTAGRALFVRHCAPYESPIGAGVVRRAIHAAYLRCGWTHSRVHLLRHSMASRLLRSGTPLKEISDLLRHRSIDTAAIYAKVDINRLSSVALPWPGRQI